MSNNPPTKNCKVCGEEFAKKVNDSENYWSTKRFCSRECSYEFRRKERVKKECPVCEEKFEVLETQKDRRTFCSNECYSTDLSNNSERYSSLFEKGHDGYDSSPWQGKTFSEKHCQAISEALQGISRSEEYIKENLEGENHWNWQGGKSFVDYPSSFNSSLKRKVRMRDGFECVNCGLSQDECVDEHGKKLAAHHVDGDKSNTSLSNLVSLCTSCHVKHHNSGLELNIHDKFKCAEF